MGHRFFSPQPVEHTELGPMARHLREMRALKLREAAAELGVSISALSQAERGVLALERLALRAINHHLQKAAEAAVAEPGIVRERFHAYGGAQTILAEVRGPELVRRAGLLRQALLARGFDLAVNQSLAQITAAGGRLTVDLGEMFVYESSPRASPLRKGLPVGHIVDPDECPPIGNEEQWARDIDDFATHLATATESGTLDSDLLREALRPRMPSWHLVNKTL